MRRKLLAWETAGAVFTVIIGSLLHFVFEWSGRLAPVALIAAVNESVWEHLKLAFWPSLIFAAVEYAFMRHDTRNFYPAKAAGLLIMPVTIVAIFYAYTSVVGHSILAVDISTFIIAVILGDLASYRIMRLPELSNSIRYLSAAVLIAMTLAFPIFTYYPPHLALFRDSRNGGYGIPAGLSGEH
jgi:hypothetical protein